MSGHHLQLGHYLLCYCKYVLQWYYIKQYPISKWQMTTRHKSFVHLVGLSLTSRLCYTYLLTGTNCILVNTGLHNNSSYLLMSMTIDHRLITLCKLHIPNYY